MNAAFPYRFSGGSLDPEDPTYVRRSADKDFYKGLKAGEFCYVFNSRQMGKSSLRIQTKYKLQSEGIACAEIDLTGIISKETTKEQWYLDIIKELIGSFQLKINRRTWWREHNDLSLGLRFKVFIEEILLAQIKEKIVIFFDEIDRVIDLNFELDDFFALIRAFYSKRATNPDYKRLTFALLGVAIPSDLIQDRKRTPFNVGHAIDLKGFQLNECVTLEKGLVGKVSHPQRVLEEVLKWTGGQPFLTQKLCWIVANSETLIPDDSEAKSVDDLVRLRLIENWESQDNPQHLRTIRDRILHSQDSSEQLLKLYQKILKRGAIPAKDSREEIELQLSGLVVKRDGKLTVYNPIYESVFNETWVKEQLNSFQSESPIIPGWTPLVASLAVTVLVMGVRWLGLLQSLELKTFDQLMRKLPLESEDNRFLIIGADERDIDGDGYGYPLPDAIIAQLLDKLQEYQPAAIGLDIVRDQPVPKTDIHGYQAFVTHLKHNKQLITPCAFDKDPKESIKPPPESIEEQTGFVDLYSDKDFNPQDDTIRRYLLSRTPNKGDPLYPCATPYSFSWQLAYLYLKDRGILVTFDAADKNSKFGSIVVRRLETHSGGYQNLKTFADGNQLLINYRRTHNPQKIAQQVTVRDILTNSNNFDPTWIKGRVVLISVTADSDKDVHNTPYGKMGGVFIHAHVVSQILSAVEDNRPLLWWLPMWVETFWVLFWSWTGGVIIWQLRSGLYRGIAVTLSLIFLYGLCWILLTKGGWIPLFTSGLALVISGGIVGSYITVRNKQSN
ncbi:CHASE2 domain-containing protein [Limnofasciculus baicalensis]|uniref:CHASE2 domain-containing protein n=1 Tax=Limnofasciculus baicalensis BBK-W-15 TaxID=2699891 RepID=A0AAE3GN25_9CYAN|nr:CHASE2 domain-containing protein [Limnofasciculus baicalensis]MCP2727631.1 CHASE2 domain-containing protein [Limnofasciculus baicalensis BBK-W-15]